MNRIKISEYKLRKSIMSTKEFKEFIAQYKERMSCFNDGYYNAVRLYYQFTFEINFEYHHCDWTDDKKTETYKRCFEFDDTIITSYDFRRNPSEAFAKIITRHILDVFRPKDMACFHVIDNISTKCVWWHINNMWAWSSEKVGVYHIEQECGEGWFEMQKEPEVRMRNFIDIDD